MAFGAHGLSQIEVHSIAAGIEFGGQEGVVRVLDTRPNGVPRVGVENQAGLQTAVVDAAPESENQAVLLGFEGELIVAIGRGRCQEGFVADHVVPATGHRRVAPRDAAGEVRGIGSEVEHVAAEVSAQVELILARRPPIHLGIEVVEVIARPGKGALRIDERLGQDIDVGAPATQDEARRILHEGRLHGEAGTDESEAATDDTAAGIPLFQANV